MFKMAASIGLKEVRIFIFGWLFLSYFFSDFAQDCDRFRVSIRACISDSFLFNVAALLKTDE